MNYSYRDENNGKLENNSVNPAENTPENERGTAGYDERQTANQETEKNVPATDENARNIERTAYKYNDPWTEPTYSKKQETAYNYYSPNYSAGYGYSYSAQDKKQADHYAELEEKPKKKRGGFMKAVALVLVCTILCAAAGAGSAYLVIDHYLSENDRQGNTTVVLGGQNANSDNTSSDTSNPVNADELSGTAIYKLAEKQVVGITTPYTTQNIFGQESTSAISGTGFVISEDGYILTNYHVIELAVKNGYELKVAFKDGTTYTADVVGYYEANDIAVVKIDAAGLTPVTFADSDEMQVGEKVYCVGNPLGELDFSMTSGYLSALDRLIATDSYTTINMFQMDAAVNSGNSGGPVYNSRGEVIGIVTAKYSESGVEGLGFAIPINDAVNIARDLIEYGYLTGQAYLGVSVRDVESFVTSYYNIPVGAYVESVDEGSCAQKAGIQAQDIIIAIDDNEVKSVEQLKRTLRNYNAGDTAKITVYRSSVGNMELTVTFDENTTNKK